MVQFRAFGAWRLQASARLAPGKNYEFSVGFETMQHSLSGSFWKHMFDIIRGAQFAESVPRISELFASPVFYERYALLKALVLKHKAI